MPGCVHYVAMLSRRPEGGGNHRLVGVSIPCDGAAMTRLIATLLRLGWHESEIRRLLSNVSAHTITGTIWHIRDGRTMTR